MTEAKVKTRPWDSAEHLKSEEDTAAYLAACLEEGGDDPAFIAHALGVIARAHSMSQLAQKIGLTQEGLYKALSGDKDPSFGTVLKIIKGLGLRWCVQPV